ncbi:MAG: hypothetical protein CM1200mP10_33530 [Candidatus Neomarinimicrobiota bacterium]|nr:MAG: hypothetical protein CM1200mP10_33530 [Candidatus Neomarinimicrobiota bacterium]
MMEEESFTKGAVLHLNILEKTYPLEMHLQAELSNGSLLEKILISVYPHHSMN